MYDIQQQVADQIQDRERISMVGEVAHTYVSPSNDYPIRS